MIEELDKILAFNNKLLSLKNHPDASRFARGVAAVSLVGLSELLLFSSYSMLVIFFNLDLSRVPLFNYFA